MTNSEHSLNSSGDPEAATLEAVLHTVALVASKVHPGAEVSGRLKTLQSRVQKRRSHGGARPADDIGIRVIVAEVAQCYEVIHQIHYHFEFLRGEYDDYIAQPKDNGYQSVHTTILTGCGHLVELQVRTRAMHTVAEEGSASHRLYKLMARRRKAMERVSGVRLHPFDLFAVALRRGEPRIHTSRDGRTEPIDDHDSQG